ncbi:hypothetical protein [Mycobacterium conspicuum]|uniref:Uncharacterized protein n=1 Tax=Mycobacterium conspicuum TaxID=44010 RepID=A0A1X1SRG6_9MYCO|nr:hypothetical protein [Mycobacterium conspicuum]ORV32607.1 hypothetical protein AWC00_28335 [Mycobacterium conspicuum]BBZ40886.1 hypothetical protein MCNS_39490 [Mycobacterium conspicuum]
MSESSRERAAAGDRAAELNEQIAEGHEWAAEEELGDGDDLHNAAAGRHRRVAGKDRAEAEAARGGSES